MRRALLSFVFVGAGYAGLEGLAELQDFAADVVERYPRCRTEGVRFVLVEAQDRVMPEISPTLAAFAEAELRKRGIEIRTSTMVDRVDRRLGRRSRPARSSRRGPSAGPPASSRTRSWRSSGCRSTAAAGSPRTGTAPCPARDGVWAIGDAASVPDPAERGTEALAADRPARAAPGEGRG